MPNNGYFDIERDKGLITAGTHFWCEACQVARPLDDQSSDPRYCRSCNDFLKTEAELLPATKRPSWRPKPLKERREKPIPVSQDVVLNMSTLTGKKTEVDIINPASAVRILPKRGPKFKTLPVEQITRWADEGMGSKAIAARLRDGGTEVSYKTIQRVLSGQRVLLLR